MLLFQWTKRGSPMSSTTLVKKSFTQSWLGVQAIEVQSVIPGLDGVGRGDDRARLDVLGEDEPAVAAISDDDFEGFGRKQRRRLPHVRSGGQEMRHFKSIARPTPLWKWNWPDLEKGLQLQTPPTHTHRAWDQQQIQGIPVKFLTWCS